MFSIQNQAFLRLRERRAAFKAKWCAGEFENYRNRTLRSSKHRYGLYFDGTEVKKRVVIVMKVVFLRNGISRIFKFGESIKVMLDCDNVKEEYAKITG